MANFLILRQAGTSYMETRIAAQYAMTSDVPCTATPMDGLGAHAQALRDGAALPVGSVEFVRTAMALACIPEPANLSYPSALLGFLHRQVRQVAAGSVLGHWFVKPTTTKTFTGFVFDTLADPDRLPAYDREQYECFLALPPKTTVWISEPITWQSEFRYYVSDGVIRGEGRYDDGPDERPTPDEVMVGEMAATLAGTPGAPAAFSLDVGVLSTGETALVECNDAWALGYYRGSLSHRDYMDMLWRRWNQLLATSHSPARADGALL